MRDTPIAVIRTSKDGTRRSMLLSKAAWKRIVEKPSIVGDKFELAPVVTPPKKVQTVIESPEYGLTDYDNDLKAGKDAMKVNDVVKALECFERAYAFKPSPYYKGVINKLKT